MDALETMQQSSLIALAAIATISIANYFLKFRRFSYPGLIAFCVGYVLAAGFATYMDLDRPISDLMKIAGAFIAFQSVILVGRKRVAA